MNVKKNDTKWFWWTYFILMNYLQTGRQILMEMSWTVIRECRSVTEDSNTGHWLRDNGIPTCVYTNAVVCVGRKIINFFFFLQNCKYMYLEKKFFHKNKNTTKVGIPSRLEFFSNVFWIKFIFLLTCSNVNLIYTHSIMSNIR